MPDPQRSPNVSRSRGGVDRHQRDRLLGQRGGVLWLTGLSGAGKSTLAHRLEHRLIGEGRLAYVLDGDNLRHGLCRDLGFAAADRSENIRRAGEAAALLADAGVLVLAAFISPYRADRQLLREIVGDARFLEVFVAAPLAVCEQRDPKGLYRKARAGQITGFTGIDDPYEPPLHPDLRVDTEAIGVDDATAAIHTLLHSRGFLAAPEEVQ